MLDDLHDAIGRALIGVKVIRRRPTPTAEEYEIAIADLEEAQRLALSLASVTGRAG